MKRRTLLQEIDIEFGNGSAVGVAKDAMRSQKTRDKTGGSDTTQTRAVPARSLPADTKAAVRNIIAWLKQRNLWNKVASKQDFGSSDITFKADGSAVVNFDDGGNVMVPRNIVAASVDTEEAEDIEESVFGY